MASQMGAIFCDSFSNDPELMKIEKSFSFQQHGNNRVRRMSFFNEELAKQADCVRDEEVKEGYGSCEF